MARLSSAFVYFAAYIALVVSVSFSTSENESALKKTSSSALFIFGDSTVDVGNNNYIDTIPENRADYKPYGQNGFFQTPTGRFSDGRVIVDFIAEYAKLPLIPPFLQPSSDFTHGVNFASGGAGVLTETHQGPAIDLQSQLRNFEEVRKSLAEKLGDEKAKELISEAVYFISIGSNDYIGYLGNPVMRLKYNAEQYGRLVVGNLTVAIYSLYKKGARKFGFLSLSPLGCLPALRALNPEGSEGGCFKAASALASSHNEVLKLYLQGLQDALKGFKYSNLNFYNWLQNRVNNPSKYGFKDGVNACCGSGPYGGIFTCGGTKNITEYSLCKNASEHVWWDSFHATEKIHEQFAKALWNEASCSPGLFSLEDFFFNDKIKLTIADVVDDPEAQQQSQFPY